MVAEGTLSHSGTFKITALGFPPAESRTESMIAAKVRSHRTHCHLQFCLMSAARSAKARTLAVSIIAVCRPAACICLMEHTP